MDRKEKIICQFCQFCQFRGSLISPPIKQIEQNTMETDKTDKTDRANFYDKEETGRRNSSSKNDLKTPRGGCRFI